MCGIVGVVGKIYAKERSVFKLLSELDTIRGKDSTGVCTVSDVMGQWATLKDSTTPYELFEDSGFVKMMSKPLSMAYCHNRAATKGAVSVDNAHPFHHGDIIGCHNGTLWSTNNLDGHGKFAVDSENIFYDMSKNGHLQTIKKLRGPFALCWYDAKLGTVNLVRNADRPMHYCFSIDGATLFWASESWMLSVATDRVGIKHGEIQSLPVKTLLSIKVPTCPADKVFSVESTQEVVEFWEAPKFQGNQNVWYNHRNDYGDWRGQNKKTNNIKNIWKLANLNKRFIGEVIEFSPIKLIKKGNLEYVECDVLNQAACPELRVFSTEGSRLVNRLLNGNHLFSGTVKNCTVYGEEAYIVCDNRSIKEVEDLQDLIDEELAIQDGEFKEIVGTGLALLDANNENLPEKIFTGFNGRNLSRQDYLRLTSLGCASCGDFATEKDEKDILWVGEEDWFCKQCKTTSFAQQYYAHSGGKK